MSRTMDGRLEVTLLAPSDSAAYAESLMGKELEASFKPWRRGRTLTQNAYMWALIGKVASAMGIGKKECYRNYVRDCGVYEAMPVKAEAEERFIRAWESRGDGWICERIGESKISGYVNVLAYYGTSSYDSAEMGRMLDAIIADCEELSIDHMSKEDILLLKNDD